MRPNLSQDVNNGLDTIQAEQIFKNLEKALSAGGAKLKNVIQWSVYAAQGQPVPPAFEVVQRV